MLGEILVVDDSPDWRNKLKAILEEDGFSVRSAKRRDEALDILAEQPIHVAIIDLVLDEASPSDDEGFSLLEEIHKLGLNEMIRSLILTGHATPEYARRAFAKYGVIDFFEKSKFEEERDRFREVVRRAVMKAKYAQLRKVGFKCFKTGGKCGHTIAEDPNCIFVAMPYEPEQNNLYEYGLKPLQLRLKCEITRADEGRLSIDLMCKICQLIQRAGICIVDITSWNANVIFELGLMYGWGKDVILLKHARERAEKVDLKGMEYVSYELDDFDSLRTALSQMLTEKGIRSSSSGGEQIR